RAQCMPHDLAWNPDEPGVLADDGSDRSERRPSRGSKEFDADLLQQIEGSFMHRVELILVEEVHMAECVPRWRPGYERLHAARLWAAPPSASGRGPPRRIAAGRICNHSCIIGR